MITCTFFGHRDAPWEIKDKAKKAIIELITQHGVELFLVGDSDGFDRMVKNVLSELQPIYDFKFFVVLSRIPTKNRSEQYFDYSISVLPDGIESVLPRFRIDFRNKYMLKSSDYVISYIEREYGGAFKYYEKAKRKKLTVINLAEK